VHEHDEARHLDIVTGCVVGCDGFKKLRPDSQRLLLFADVRYTCAVSIGPQSRFAWVVCVGVSFVVVACSSSANDATSMRPVDGTELSVVTSQARTSIDVDPVLVPNCDIEGQLRRAQQAVRFADRKRSSWSFAVELPAPPTLLGEFNIPVHDAPMWSVADSTVLRIRAGGLIDEASVAALVSDDETMVAFVAPDDTNLAEIVAVARETPNGLAMVGSCFGTHFQQQLAVTADGQPVNADLVIKLAQGQLRLGERPALPLDDPLGGDWSTSPERMVLPDEVPLERRAQYVFTYLVVEPLGRTASLQGVLQPRTPLASLPYFDVVTDLFIDTPAFAYAIAVPRLIESVDLVFVNRYGPPEVLVDRVAAQVFQSEQGVKLSLSESADGALVATITAPTRHELTELTGLNPGQRADAQRRWLAGG
jgi:hypothetical protein